MKAMMISASRNSEGQTARAANAVLAGLGEKGFECERVFLPTLRIESCHQCDDEGWGLCRSERRCVIEDDFAEVVSKMAAADVLVFATPVYMSEPAESMKAFTDRLRRIVGWQKEGNPLLGKQAVCLSVAGGGGGGAPKCAWMMDGLLKSYGLELQDNIPLRRQNLQMKLPHLADVGRWLADCVEDAEG